LRRFRVVSASSWFRARSTHLEYSCSAPYSCASRSVAFPGTYVVVASAAPSAAAARDDDDARRFVARASTMRRERAHCGRTLVIARAVDARSRAGE